MMIKGRKKQVLLVVIVIITIILIWNQSMLRVQDNNSDSFLIPPVRLSTLPEDMARSIALVEERARDKQARLLKNNRLLIDIRSLTNKDLISSNTPLIIQTYYKGSEQLVQRITSMPDSFVGLSPEDLSAIANEWQVKFHDFSDALVLYQEVDALTAADKEIMHLGVKDGRVAIFYGQSGQKYLMKMTDISVEELPLSEQKALEKGVEIYSQEELLSILEGLVSIDD